MLFETPGVAPLTQSKVPAADYLMIPGQPERARAILLEGIDNYTRQGRSDHYEELPGLRGRLERHFPEVTA